MYSKSIYFWRVKNTTVEAEEAEPEEEEEIHMGRNKLQETSV